ncbi:MAG: hypothetical protein P8172_09405 [Gammaproteobacteria bacterium]
MSNPEITDSHSDSRFWNRIAPLGHSLGLLPRINVFRETQFMQWLDDAGFDLEEVWQSAPKASYCVVARLESEAS